ncbi:MAG: hypothetical protein R3B48_14580 [Kofleriaceae bacterium]
MSADEYRQYLERWERALGPSEPGTFAKYSGRLIKKMTEAEFAPVHQEYEGLAERYHESVVRGDTINDIVVRLLRDRAATLVREPPA